MNKLTRIIAGGITSLIAVGALVTPAFAAEAEAEPTIESSMCEAVDGQIDAVTDLVADGLALLGEQSTAVDDAKDDMDASTTELASTGLAFVRALDGVGNETATLDAFVEAATDYSEDVTAWVDAVDEQADTTLQNGLNESVLDYLNGLCGVI